MNENIIDEIKAKIKSLDWSYSTNYYIKCAELKKEREALDNNRELIGDNISFLKELLEQCEECKK